MTFTLWCSDGTPGGQTVSERFVLDWATVLVSSFGAIVVRCDGRGSDFQGTNVLHRIHKKLGVFEEQDQKDALEYEPLLTVTGPDCRTCCILSEQRKKNPV